MTNSLIIITILSILIASTQASGTFELLISSPKTIVLEPTVCANFECPAPDELSTARKVQAGVALRFDTGQYQGESRERIDLHLKIIEPTTNELIAIEHFRPSADSQWNTAPIVIQTTQGFNITVLLRNKCESSYYGNRCGRFCVPSRERHYECSPQGERRCTKGWTGQDCSNPICPGGCNARGRCVAPNQCSCTEGFNGTQCEQCIPRAGCVNGECLNDIPNTCKCREGFIGDRCDVDMRICSTQKPCQNGGRCSIDSKSSTGYKCECPFNFVGPQCRTPLSRVRCSSADHVCHNGGVCISMDERTLQCKCPIGFSGKFCEVGMRRDCSTMRCSKSSTCHISGDVAICVENEKTQEPSFAPKFVRREEEKKTMKNEEEAVDDLESRLLMIVLVLFCIVGLIFSTIVFYVRIIAKSDRTSSTSTILPTTSPLSSTSSPVYKVCIIDTECGGNPSNSSDSEPDHCLHRHSPPPAYSSPVMSRVYKSIPMDDNNDNLSFRV